MDSKKQSEIVKKYWEGKSTKAEEELLLSSNLEQLEESDQNHFNQLKAFSKLSLDPSFKIELAERLQAPERPPLRPVFLSMLWKVAAMFLLTLGTYYLFVNEPVIEVVEPIAMEEEDPRKAFEEAKQALLLVSEKLNKASKISVGLDKFETAQEKIKQGS